MSGLGFPDPRALESHLQTADRGEVTQTDRASTDETTAALAEQLEQQATSIGRMHGIITSALQELAAAEERMRGVIHEAHEWQGVNFGAVLQDAEAYVDGPPHAAFRQTLQEYLRQPPQ